MSYSKKYRERTIEYRQAGHTLEETGDLGKKKLHRSFRKIDPEKQKSYVAEHPDAYQSEMAKAFGCSESGIRDALRRHKITRKKDNPISGAESARSSNVSGPNQGHTAGKDCLCGWMRHRYILVSGIWVCVAGPASIRTNQWPKISALRNCCR